MQNICSDKLHTRRIVLLSCNLQQSPFGCSRQWFVPATLDQIYDMTLAQAGFLTPYGDRRPGLLDDRLISGLGDAGFKYAKLFNEVGSETLVGDLIYEIPSVDESPGIPCAYVKIFPDPSQEEICRIRTQLWNYGRIPTLWIVSENGLRIYNAFGRPSDTDLLDPTSHLLGDLRIISGRLQGIQEFHRRRFDDGSFWYDGSGQGIDAADRVDKALLQDLSDTETLLRKEHLTAPVAHALLGKTIFVKYLEDRGILNVEHLRRHGTADTFTGLLQDEHSARSFFAWLGETFNGDLFPRVDAELKSVTSVHFEIVHRFLSGHRMEGYPDTQARLWPYSFRLIPIELISSIYEMFAHAGDPDTAETLSVHYTRFNLVELILSRAMRATAHSAKVLDPACGSGVFLVEAFRRLVRQKEQDLQRSLSRAELEDTLRSQIYGVDIDPNAVSVAAFSLYLALLELDPDPFAPDALRLPHLVAGGSPDGPSNLYVQDFFNTQHPFNTVSPFSDKSFDLIVSNPPWTALKSDSAPADPESVGNGTQWGFKYLKDNKIPYRNPDQGFLWRARDFANLDATIAMVVGSRLLHLSTGPTKRWRERFFAENSVRSIVDFSDLVAEKVLFGSKSSTMLPACVIIFSPRKPHDNQDIEYLTPKRYPGVGQRDEIVLHSGDLQILPQSLTNDGVFRWKTAFRGRPRDIRILYRLSVNPTLDQVLDQAGIVSKVHRGRGVTFGKNNQREAQSFQEIPFLPGDMEKKRYALSVNDLPIFPNPTVSNKSAKLILDLPAMILSRSLVDSRPSAALAVSSAGRSQLVISQSYYGISFPSGLEWLAPRLNATLNSEFALYWSFMTSSALGLDRRLVEAHDWLDIPMPKNTLDSHADTWDTVLQLEESLRNGSLSDERVPLIQAELDSAVYALYDLSEQDLVVIRNTVRHTIFPYLDGSVQMSPKRPNVEELKAYALRLCKQLDGILTVENQRIMPTICTLPAEIGLTACQFRMVSSDDESDLKVVNLAGVETMLNEMPKRLQLSVADHLYIQHDLRVYDEDRIWIIKLSDNRLWTESVALHDGDLIMRDHMEGTTR